TPAGPGIDHQIVLTFPAVVAFTTIVPTSGVATVDSFSGNNSTTVTINLKSVSNAQKTTITLVGVNDGTNTNDVAVQMGVLVGDVNASTRVDSTDIFQIRQHTLENASASTFLLDLNESGRIDSTDIFIARQQTLTSLP